MPAVRGAGPRMMAWVKRARCSVASGRKANRCQICGYSPPAAWLIRILSQSGPGRGLFSTPDRNMGSMGTSDLKMALHGPGADAARRAFPLALQTGVPGRVLLERLQTI